MKTWSALLAGALLIGGGCTATPEAPASEYMPDMARGPAYKAFAPNPATRNGLTLQPPVAGTVARGARPLHYGPGEAEAVRAGHDLGQGPPPTPESLAEGRALYEIYCLVCHGARGAGDGPLATKIPRPPAYWSDRVRVFPPGRIFHVISFGAGKMPAYAAQLAVDDRWKVVAHVTTLQAAAAPAPAGGSPGGAP